MLFVRISHYGLSFGYNWMNERLSVNSGQIRVESQQKQRAHVQDVQFNLCVAETRSAFAIDAAYVSDMLAILVK